MPDHKIKAGFLFPQSELFPALKSELLQGIHLALQQQKKVSLEIIPLFIDSGGIQSVEKALNACCYAHNCDLVIAFAGSKVMVELSPLVQKLQMPILVLNFGEHIPDSGWDQPFLHFLDLGAWQTMWALGKWGQQQFKGTVALNTSMFDAGYHLQESFRVGLLEGGGTEMHFNLLKNEPGQSNVNPLFDSMSQQDFSWVFALLSGREALHFLEQYSLHQSAEQKPVFLPAFLLEEVIILEEAPLKYGFTASSWHPSIDHPINQYFFKIYQEQHHRAPGHFSLLGYETGLVLSAVMENIESGSSSSKQMEALLSTLVLEGPRGRIDVSEKVFLRRLPVYIYQVEKIEYNRFEYSMIHKVSGDLMNDEELQYSASVSVSGWQNPYLCL